MVVWLRLQPHHHFNHTDVFYFKTLSIEY